MGTIDADLVTVADFRVFVEAGGYDDAPLWTPAGWAWRCKAHIDAPRFWDEPQWAAYLAPDHPVVGVSAFEAEAFASYRDARLPSEGAWEGACRCGDQRKFPWGNDWDDGACAHRDAGPRCTSPVGCYARGTTPSGVRDLCGSVWQWTQTERGDRRVVCGGAWNNLRRDIGCHARNAYPPSARFSNLGFRLAHDS